MIPISAPAEDKHRKTPPEEPRAGLNAASLRRPSGTLPPETTSDSRATTHELIARLPCRAQRPGQRHPLPHAQKKTFLFFVRTSQAMQPHLQSLPGASHAHFLRGHAPPAHRIRLCCATSSASPMQRRCFQPSASSATLNQVSPSADRRAQDSPPHILLRSETDNIRRPSKRAAVKPLPKPAIALRLAIPAAATPTSSAGLETRSLIGPRTEARNQLLRVDEMALLAGIAGKLHSKRQK